MDVFLELVSCFCLDCSSSATTSDLPLSSASYGLGWSFSPLHSHTDCLPIVLVSSAKILYNVPEYLLWSKIYSKDSYNGRTASYCAF